MVSEDVLYQSSIIYNNDVKTLFKHKRKRGKENGLQNNKPLYTRSYERIQEELESKLAKAQKAYESWSKTSFEQRASLMKKAAQLARERRDELAAINTIETGKLVTIAAWEMNLCADIMEYYVDNAKDLLKPHFVKTTDQMAGHAVGIYQPLGIIYMIEPWNVPFFQMTRPSAAQLMAGNVVVLKHASNCSQCALAMEKLYRDAGFPEGCFTNLFIDYDQSNALIADKRICGITLTGSTPVGRQIAAESRKNLKKCVMELGGSDVMVVLPDADMKKAVTGAIMGRMTISGQVCAGDKRMFIHESSFDALKAGVTQAIDGMVIGDPLDPNTTLSPLCSKKAADKVRSQIAKAVANGATATEVGPRVPQDSAFVQPTILTGVTPDNPIFHEEIFGPVLMLFSYETEEEAIKLANGTDFGLGSSVYSEDPAHAAKVAAAMESGAVSINQPTMASPAIEYTVKEDEVKDYETSTSGDAKSGFVLTNSHKTETVNISGTKTWADNDNQDGARPDSITIRLMADGKEIQKQEVKADKDGNWTYAFNDLPKYANGQEITYTVSEDAVKDYTTTQKGNDFTNTHKVGKTSVSVKKIWKDNNNQDGIRPEKITVELLANGEKTDKTLTLDEKNNWSGSFTNLDAKKKGKAIAYSVAEVSVPKGYTSEISGNATEGYIINNTHKTETVDISGTKTWKDNDNQDGKRPDKITVTLMANGEDVQSKEIAGDWTYTFNNLSKYDNGKEIKYTIKEDKVAGYTSEVKGYDLINTHKIEKTSVAVKKQWDDTKNQDGKRPTEVTVHLYADGKDTSKAVTLSAKNDWQASFNDLDVNKDGKAIEYTVKEDEVKDYETSTSGDAKSGFVLTNSHKTETVNISGTKTWADNDNQDGARPDSITIRLMADGKEIQKQEVKADKDGNWTYAFNDLPKYANGQEITYTVSEDAVKDYTTTQKGNDFTNTHKVGKTSVSVKKIWKDNNNQDGIRPEKITVELLANGEKTDKTLTLDEKNNWSGSFTDLDAKKKGKDIQYSIAEVSVPKGYKSIITGDATKGYIVTNTHTTHRTTTGKKTNHTSGTNTGMETNVRFYSLSTIVSLLAIAFFRRRFVK